MEWVRLGEAVRDTRRRMGWTQAQLGARAGMTPQTVGRIERGDEPFAEASLLAVEAALGWEPGSVAAVLAGGRPKPQADEDLAAVLAAWQQLSLRDRRVLRAVVEALLNL